MVRAMIEQMLGSWGTALLDFYYANSLYINLAVVLYGGLVVLSWINLKGIRKQLVQEITSQLGNIPNLEDEAQAKKALRKIKIPWERAIERARFPFIAQQTSFLPRRASLETIQAWLPPEELAGDALKILSGQRSGAGRRSRK